MADCDGQQVVGDLVKGAIGARANPLALETLCADGAGGAGAARVQSLPDTRLVYPGSARPALCHRQDNVARRSIACRLLAPSADESRVYCYFSKEYCHWMR